MFMVAPIATLVDRYVPVPLQGAEPRTGPEPIQGMQPIFHEEFDIDIEAETESMFVPKFELGSGARFFNDFHFVSVGVLTGLGLVSSLCVSGTGLLLTACGLAVEGTK